MNVETLEADPVEVREKMRTYRKHLHRRADAEYEQALKGYEEMAKGRKLLHLSNVIAAAPTDEKGRPMLAIARADRKQVKFSWPDRHSSTALFDCSKFFDGRWNRRENLTRTVSMGRRPPSSLRYSSDGNGYSLVPMVPPDAREQAGNPRLANCWILWEVEQWADRPVIAVPDRDPFLLKHVGGELYAILAAWDLSDLERAVMAGRAIT